jgi:hypothetical protein
MTVICRQEMELGKPPKQKLAQFIHATRKDKFGSPCSKLITGKENRRLSCAERLNQCAIDPLNPKLNGNMARGGVRDSIGKERRVQVQKTFQNLASMKFL